MRGWPVFQWIVFACLWGLLLFPVLRMTHRPKDVRISGSGVQQPGQVSENLSSWVSLQFAHQPNSFALLRDGHELWVEAQPQDRLFERELELTGDEVISLELQVSWPDEAGVTAVECRVAPDIRPERSAVFWGRGETRGLLEFDWSEGPGHD